MTVTVENKRVICPSTCLGQSGTIVKNTLEAPYLLHRLSQALVGQRGTKIGEKLFLFSVKQGWQNDCKLF